MPASGSYGTTVDRIKRELDRQSASADETHIKEHVVDAVEFYKSDRFRWNQKQLSFTTTDGVQRIDTNHESAPASLFDRAGFAVSTDSIIEVDWVRYERTASNSYHLTRMPAEQLDHWNGQSATESDPAFFAFRDNAIWLYPTPSTTGINVRCHCLIELGDRSGSNYGLLDVATNEAFTNDFFTKMEPMIRHRALATLFMNVYYKMDYAQMHFAMAEQYRSRYLAEMTQANVVEQVLPDY